MQFLRTFRLTLAFSFFLLSCSASLCVAKPATPKQRDLLYADLVPASERAPFCQAVRLTAERLHIEPDWLMIVFRFESAGTFRANVRNKYSGATGLIQFLPKTAKSLGTTTNYLARMTLVQQLAYVEEYFFPYSGKMQSVYDVYIVVFAPAFLGLPKHTILYRADAVSEVGKNRYKWNKIMDLNLDGQITIREVHHQIRKYVL